MTEIQKYRSIVARLNFIQARLDKLDYKESQAAWDATNKLGEELRKLYGPKIAFEIEIKTPEK